MMLSLIFMMSMFIFLLKSYSVILSLIMIEILSFILLLQLVFTSSLSSPSFLIIFSLFILLSVTGIVVYFHLSRFVGRDYVSLSSINSYYLSMK